MRAASFAFALFFPHVLLAQAGEKPTYDVSTVKPHLESDGASFGATKGAFRAINYDLTSLIANAWGLRRDQVVNEPAWVDNEHWDVTAKATGTDPDMLKDLSKQDINAMNQTLIVGRFQLKAHMETRQGLILNLVPARSGLKLRLLPGIPPGEKADDPTPRNSFTVRWSSEGILWTAHGIGSKSLVDNIAENLQQTVIDKTGLPPEAQFDVNLRFAPEDDPSPTHSDAPSLRTGLEEQLGLHLDSTRGPIVVIVVDHVERPTAN